MPTYEYRCPEGHDFEKFYRKISDAGAEVPCPQCGQTGARKISAGAGLVFKGSGFYITDYGKDGKKDQQSAGRTKSESASESASAATTSGGEGGSSSDAKPAAETRATSAPAPKESGSKESRSKESGSKESRSKESRSKESPAPKPGKPSSE